MTTPQYKGQFDLVEHSWRVWGAIVAHIRHNPSGEVRQCKDEILFNTDSCMGEENAPCTYIWEKGNFECDCNRRGFFKRAGGDDDLDFGECGSGEFSVNLENPKTGVVFYREFK